MFKAARNLLRRFGFVSVLLLTLASAMPAAAAEVCTPGPDARTSVSAPVQSNSCATDDCRDCGLICSHSCCHAPHVAVVAEATAPLPAALFTAPRSWADILGAPLRAPSGPKRPPRA